jgi:hypothetical protein
VNTPLRDILRLTTLLDRGWTIALLLGLLTLAAVQTARIARARRAAPDTPDLRARGGGT